MDPCTAAPANAPEGAIDDPAPPSSDPLPAVPSLPADVWGPHRRVFLHSHPLGGFVWVPAVDPGPDVSEQLAAVLRSQDRDERGPSDQQLADAAPAPPSSPSESPSPEMTRIPYASVCENAAATSSRPDAGYAAASTPLPPAPPFAMLPRGVPNGMPLPWNVVAAFPAMPTPAPVPVPVLAAARGSMTTPVASRLRARTRPQPALVPTDARTASEGGEGSGSASSAPVAAFNAVLREQLRMGAELHPTLLAYMKRAGVEPDAVTRELVLRSCVRHGRLRSALRLLLSGGPGGLARAGDDGPAAFAVVLDAMARRGRLRDALRLRATMRAAGVAPDASTFFAVARACRRALGAVPPPPDAPTLFAGCWGPVRGGWSRAAGNGPVRDADATVRCLCASAMQAELIEARALDERAYREAVWVCAWAAMPEETLDAARRMVGAGFAPDASIGYALLRCHDPGQHAAFARMLRANAMASLQNGDALAGTTAAIADCVETALWVYRRPNVERPPNGSARRGGRSVVGRGTPARRRARGGRDALRDGARPRGYTPPGLASVSLLGRPLSAAPADPLAGEGSQGAADAPGDASSLPGGET